MSKKNKELKKLFDALDAAIEIVDKAYKPTKKSGDVTIDLEYEQVLTSMEGLYDLVKKKGKIVKREVFSVSEDEVQDFADNSNKIIKGILYKFIDTYLTKGDGEWHAVVMQRETDGKYFEYTWGYSHSGGNYYYEGDWYEVTPKTISKIKYGWDGE